MDLIVLYIAQYPTAHILVNKKDAPTCMMRPPSPIPSGQISKVNMQQLMRLHCCHLLSNYVKYKMMFTFYFSTLSLQ